MATEQVIDRGVGQELQRAARVRAAIVDAAEEIDRLFRDLDHHDGRARLGRMRLEAVLEFQARQVAGEQEIALDGADVHRPLGGDPVAVVREEIAVSGKSGRPLDGLDVAFHDLDANDGAVGIELLGRHDGAREHIAVAAILAGDASGEIVDLLQRDLAADQVRVELAQLRGGVDRGAHDLDPADDQRCLAGSRRSFDPGRGDGGTAGLGQRHRGALESLTLPARLVAGRNDLCTGRNDLCNCSERNADHRQSRRNGAHAREHGPTPLYRGTLRSGASCRQSRTRAVSAPTLAIFPYVSIRSHRPGDCRYPAASGPKGCR